MFVTGTPNGYGHPVPTPNPALVPGSTLQEGVSSDEFKTALENSDVFIYVGHHYNNGTIKLSDGNVTPYFLFLHAAKLPKYVFLDACQSSGSLPPKGRFPGTTFIGLKPGTLANNVPAVDAAIMGGNELTSAFRNGINPAQAAETLIKDLGSIPDLPGGVTP